MARILGVVCILLALAVAGLGVYGFVQGTEATTPYGDSGTLSEQAQGVYLLASLISALMMATIGATAIVAANAASQAVKAARAADRLAREHRPAPAYAPTPQPPPTAPWQPPAAPALPPRSEEQPAPDAPRWGPPTGTPPR